MSRRNKTFEDIVSLLELREIYVLTNFSEKGGEVEILSHTKLGGEQVFSIWCVNKSDPQEFSRQMLDYLNNFDPLEEAMLWVDDKGRGTRGAPGTVVDLTADYEEWKEEMTEAALEIKKIEVR